MIKAAVTNVNLLCISIQITKHVSLYSLKVDASIVLEGLISVKNVSKI